MGKQVRLIAIELCTTWVYYCVNFNRKEGTSCFGNALGVPCAKFCMAFVGPAGGVTTAAIVLAAINSTRLPKPSGYLALSQFLYK